MNGEFLGAVSEVPVYLGVELDTDGCPTETNLIVPRDVVRGAVMSLPDKIRLRDAEIVMTQAQKARPEQ